MDHSVIPFAGAVPVIHDSVFLAPGSRVIGDVHLGADSSVWFNTVVRGDVNWIRIGSRSNIQDLCVLHVTHDTHPLSIGDDVTIGHSVTVHGCTIGDRCLVGMGAIVLDGAVLSEDSMVAAGAVVTPGFVVPSGKLVAGIPARVMRDLEHSEIVQLREAAIRYVEYARTMREQMT